ncbi:MAG: hypothetical protein ACI30R_05940 [Sodaliphilus sp.]
MKKLLYLAFAAVLLISCNNNGNSNSEKSEPEAPQLDSTIISRVEVVKAKLPIEQGRFAIEECNYDGKTVALKLRALDDDPELVNPDMLHWLPTIMLNNIHQLDTLMIKRLVELNQPLTYNLYQNNDSTFVKKFTLPPTQLKSRAKGSNMF